MAATRLAFCQFDAREADRAGNLSRVRAAASEASGEGAALLVLPELWASGFDLAAARAEGGWEQEIAAIRGLSEEFDLAIIGTYLEPSDNPGDSRPSNSAIAHERGEERARYRKVHLFGPLDEPDHIRRGEELPAPFPLAGLRVAMAICYDLRFPEVFRPAATRGVDLIVLCAQWPIDRIEQWKTLLAARAIENQCYVLGVNRRGPFGETLFGGHSRLVSPKGEICVEMTDGSGLGFGEVDLEALRKWREGFPVLGDRRPDLYG